MGAGCSVVGFAETLPHSYVEVRGHVTLSEDLDELAEVGTRAGARYADPFGAGKFGQRNAVPGGTRPAARRVG